jgi:hypothetical protein
LRPITLTSPTASAQLDAGAIDTGISDGAATAPALSSADFAFSIERYDALAGAWVRLNPTEQAFFFDRARCECAEDTSNFTGSIKIAIEPSAAAVQKIQSLLAANPVGSGTARLYAGGKAVNCLFNAAHLIPGHHGSEAAGGKSCVALRWAGEMEMKCRSGRSAPR